MLNYLDLTTGVLTSFLYFTSLVKDKVDFLFKIIMLNRQAFDRIYKLWNKWHQQQHLSKRSYNCDNPDNYFKYENLNDQILYHTNELNWSYYVDTGILVHGSLWSTSLLHWIYTYLVTGFWYTPRFDRSLYFSYLYFHFNRSFNISNRDVKLFLNPSGCSFLKINVGGRNMRP